MSVPVSINNCDFSSLRLMDLRSVGDLISIKNQEFPLLVAANLRPDIIGHGAGIHLESVSFPKLKYLDLTADKCHITNTKAPSLDFLHLDIACVLPGSDYEFFNQPYSLFIFQNVCEFLKKIDVTKLKYLVTRLLSDDIGFETLIKDLDLSNLESFHVFLSEEYTDLCGELIPFFNGPNLKEFKVDISKDSFDNLGNLSEKLEPSFPNLKRLIISSLRSSFKIRGLVHSSLEDIIITSVDTTYNIFTGHFENLQRFCALVHIFEPLEIGTSQLSLNLSAPNLKELNIEGHSLEVLELFNYKHLKHLQISECDVNELIGAGLELLNTLVLNKNSEIALVNINAPNLKILETQFAPDANIESFKLLVGGERINDTDVITPGVSKLLDYASGIPKNVTTSHAYDLKHFTVSDIERSIGSLKNQEHEIEICGQIKKFRISAAAERDEESDYYTGGWHFTHSIETEREAERLIRAGVRPRV
ncbi:hypothetical protein BN7_1683 [Wickerhamomyces ciferrii]|uniref:Internalin-I n=1 Tax=Wickerhamomyces ciferrii (strain ATCC 14091 / BCRC 22168 / CBS 111 / JCM 3599 / NBRC 0793 / NRRL Y-1031 F-60-10) TaxID=1206466 RepID=K0KLY7_WICCF|nr:uncharacterized protein BN7_1683 [Wickerhamomyces ciferrii]CCH42138.1 hypothetical protein BN7_1683 [Wickerhamomyces ciferrii]